jgi:hypothetical protein
MAKSALEAQFQDASRRQIDNVCRAFVNRAGAEVRLQRANRFDDVYLFYDSITYQDNRPSNQPGPTPGPSA